jgi:hypothetical protein
MPVNYPKFDKKIQEQIDASVIQQAKTRPGTITSFDKRTNTATVVLEAGNSSSIGNVIANVPCPINNGIQSVAPAIGTRCLVQFRDNNEANPYIISYYDDRNINRNFNRNYTVTSGIPRFLVH